MIQTSYGSAISTRIHNPRRGQKRVLATAIDDAIRGTFDDEEDDDSLQVGSEPPVPEEEPSHLSDVQEENEEASSEVVGQKVQDTHEEEEEDPTPTRQPRLRRSTRQPSVPAETPQLAQPKKRGRPSATRRNASTPATERPAGVVDSSRSFGQESSIFRDATIFTPQPDIRQVPPQQTPDEPAESRENPQPQPQPEPVEQSLPQQSFPPSRQLSSTPQDSNDWLSELETQRKKPGGQNLRDASQNRRQPGSKNPPSHRPVSMIGQKETAALNRSSGHQARLIGERPPQAAAAARTRSAFATNIVRGFEVTKDFCSHPISHARHISNGMAQPCSNFICRVLQRSLSKGMGFAGPVFLVLAAVMAFSFASSAFSATAGYGDVHWYGWGDIQHNIGQFIPYAVRHPRKLLGGEGGDWARIADHFTYEIAHLKQSIKQSAKLQGESLAKLENLLPKIIRIELSKDNKPVIANDFWFALRDLIYADDDIFTVRKSGSEIELLSDKQWSTINSRFEKGLESGHMPKVWERWLENNREKVTNILAINQTAPQVTTDGLTAEGLMKVLKSKLNKGELSEFVMTREEFVVQLNQEFASHQQKISVEFKGMQSKLEQYVEKTIKEASNSSPKGMTHHEATKLVESKVRKAISDAHLGALAKGKVMGKWESEIRDKVNFLTYNSGALIDPRKSSPIYQEAKPNPFSKAWIRWGQQPKVGKDHQSQSQAYNSVLFKWDDEGDCWCGAVSQPIEGTHYRGVWTTINLGHTVVPEYLAIEHIRPRATLKPGARPKRIELWGAYDSVEQQARLKDFGEAHFDGEMVQHCPKDDPSVCFHLLGTLTYPDDAGDTNDGVFVHKLSEELLKLRAATDQVRVVAVDNYGDGNQTCFYRIRLFGEKVAEEETIG